jgi:hypothetical protein
MKWFIEVHRNGEPISINIAAISVFGKSRNKQFNTEVNTFDSVGDIFVDEDYKLVKEYIEKAQDGDRHG